MLNKILIIIWTASLFIVSAISIKIDRTINRAKEKIKIVEKNVVEYKTVYRNYTKYTPSEFLEELKKYDTGIPGLDGKMTGNNIFKAEANLNKRKWSREFKLSTEVYQSGNWKFYLIVGVAGVVAGGIYKYKK